MPPATKSNIQQPAVDLEWLVRLRWGAILGQLCLLLLAQWALDAQLPLAVLLGVVSVELISNVALRRYAQSTRPRSALTLVVLGFDMVLLTVLLWLSGGSSNPFSFLYLVHITVAAMVLPVRWTWGLWALAAVCSGALFLFDDLSGPGAADHHHAHDMHVHLRGMWVAFLVAATFIVYFVQRIRALLAYREAQLTRARERSANNQRLISLATLAAGAAHELATPLSTIAVVAADLDDSRNSPQELHEDAELIRREVERCRRILSRLSSDTGSPHGETPTMQSVDALIAATLDDAPWHDRLHVELLDGCRAQKLRIPMQAFGSALRSLVDNAFDALSANEELNPTGGEDQGVVVLRVRVLDGSCFFEVHDNGEGMNPQVVERALEPFFTTKATGHGMGLGLFLARAVAEQLGGDMSLRSRLGHGSVATLRVPLPLSDDAG